MILINRTDSIFVVRNVWRNDDTTARHSLFSSSSTSIIWLVALSRSKHNSNSLSSDVRNPDATVSKATRSAEAQSRIFALRKMRRSARIPWDFVSRRSSYTNSWTRLETRCFETDGHTETILEIKFNVSVGTCVGVRVLVFECWCSSATYGGLGVQKKQTSLKKFHKVRCSTIGFKVCLNSFTRNLCQAQHESLCDVDLVRTIQNLKHAIQCIRKRVRRSLAIATHETYLCSCAS